VFWSASGPVHYLHLLLQHHLYRARHAEDRGASAIEWVIISAILVAIAVAVGGVIYNKIKDKADSLNLDTTGVGGP
jgi:Flp pilus assembly pilin Flp